MYTSTSSVFVSDCAHMNVIAFKSVVLNVYAMAPTGITYQMFSIPYIYIMIHNGIQITVMKYNEIMLWFAVITT